MGGGKEMKGIYGWEVYEGAAHSSAHVHRRTFVVIWYRGFFFSFPSHFLFSFHFYPAVGRCTNST